LDGARIAHVPASSSELATKLGSAMSEQIYDGNYYRALLRVNSLCTSTFAFVIPPRKAETGSCPGKGVWLRQQHLSPLEAHTFVCV